MAIPLALTIMGGTAFAAASPEAVPAKPEVKQEAPKAEIKEAKPELTVEAPKVEAPKAEEKKAEAPKKAKAKKSNTLKKYVSKGKLTEAEAAKIKEEVKNELKNEIISEIKAELKSELAPEVKEAVNTDIKAAIAADKSKEVELAKKDKDKEFKITGYTQVRYTDDNTPGTVGSSWNVARTRLIMNKKHDDKLSFFAQTNMTGNTAATATNSNDWKMTLLDANIAYKPTADWEIRAGQFILPFGLEVPLGPKNIFLVNYSQAGSNTAHEVAGDDSRDMGVQFKYNQKGNPFTYVLAATNGEGINRKNDSNDGKNVVGKVIYTPDKFWQFGVSGQSGKRFKAAGANTAATLATAQALYGATKAIATTAGDFKRDRAGIDAKYTKNRWFAQAEYQWLRTGMAGRISDLLGRGGYIEGGYKFNPKFELALKEDVFQWDVSGAAGDTTTKAHVLGLNWYFHKMAKWQFVYENRKENPAVNNDRFYSQIQLEF